MDEALAVGEGKGLSQVERLADTFVAPAKTFTDILRSASWWAPFILGSVIAYALTFGIAQKVGWSQLVDNQIAANPATAQQLADNPERADMTRKMMMYSFEGSFYGAPVVSFLFVLIIALALWPTINFVFAGRAKYGQVAAVVSYAYLPASIKALIAAALLFFGGPSENFTVENMLGTSPGYYIDTPGALKTFLTFFDVFTLWTLVLMSIGLAIVAGTKRSTGYISVFGWWALIVLVSTGFAAAR